MVEYSEERELTEVLAQVLQDAYFKSIRDNGIKVTALMKTDLTDAGEAKPVKGLGVGVKKVSDAERALIKNGPAYLLVVDYSKWNEYNGEQREALIHHGLCHVKVEKADSGKLKLGKNQPEVTVFLANMERHGAWFQNILNLRELLRGVGKAVAATLPGPKPKVEPKPESDEDEPEPEAEEKPLSPPPRKKK